MTPEEAFIIIQYPDVPRNRDEQEKLIAVLYPRIHDRELGEIDEKQIYAIARDMYARAHKTWKKFMEEDKREAANEKEERLERDYNNYLYEIFNFPLSQRKYVNPSDLERQLLE